jgi:rhodanese-related sulfurtransferase
MKEGGEKVVLVDVRSPEDYAKEHIAGAISIPLDSLDKTARSLLKSDEDIIVYCDSFVCSASTSASNMLTRLGYRNVRDYKGGIREWKQAGLAIEGNEA